MSKFYFYPDDNQGKEKKKPLPRDPNVQTFLEFKKPTSKL
jgi:hypothetical protein